MSGTHHEGHHEGHHGMADHIMASGMNHSMPHSTELPIHNGMHPTDMPHEAMSESGTGHHMVHGNGGGHSMAMAFHGGYSEVILFDCWKTSSIGGLIGSMIGIMIMAALYEGLKYYREYLFWKTYNALQYRSVTMPAGKSVVADDNRVVQPTMFSWMHSFQTFLHIIQIVLSYFLMLIFMTYNVWLCFAVVLGAAIGYFLFGWKKSVIVDVTEHCH